MSKKGTVEGSNSQQELYLACSLAKHCASCNLVLHKAPWMFFHSAEACMGGKCRDTKYRKISAHTGNQEQCCSSKH
jgi:hypothetical protein